MIATRTRAEGGRHILFDSGRTPEISPSHFDPAWWIANDRVIDRASGRGTVLIVAEGVEQWVVRHYHRGGWAAKFSGDRYLWVGLERTRPWQEWLILQQLHDAGLPVPRPVAALVTRTGAFYTGDLITERIGSTETLARVLHDGPLPEDEWVALGRLIARFHAHGVRHDDINIANILRASPGAFHLIDFDKAAIVPAGAWSTRNVERLRRSLNKRCRRHPGTHFTDREWTWFLAGYATSART